MAVTETLLNVTAVTGPPSKRTTRVLTGPEHLRGIFATSIQLRCKRRLRQDHW